MPVKYFPYNTFLVEPDLPQLPRRATVTKILPANIAAGHASSGWRQREAHTGTSAGMTLWVYYVPPQGQARVVAQEHRAFAQNPFRKWSIRLSRLRTGTRPWDGGGAPPPNAEALSNADEFLQCLIDVNYPPQSVVPSVVGGVGFTLRVKGRKVYVEFNNKGNVLSLLSDGEGSPIVEKITPFKDAYRSLIEKARAYLNE